MEVIETRLGSIPTLGFGTWRLSGRACYEGVRHALEIGYRHIDTAEMYGNEDEVGRALADSGVDRDEVFVTTKVWNTNLRPADLRSAFEASLRKLDTQRTDLLLIHWPNDDVPLADTLAAMADLRDAGKTVHIGVSNFPPELLRAALDLTDVLTDQVECHPYEQQRALHEMCVERDVALTAYSPLAKGRVTRDDTLVEIGERHGKSAAQVALRWLLQQDNVVAIPRSSSAEHREANFAVFDFELSDEEMDEIFALGS